MLSEQNPGCAPLQSTQLEIIEDETSCLAMSEENLDWEPLQTIQPEYVDGGSPCISVSTSLTEQQGQYLLFNKLYNPEGLDITPRQKIVISSSLQPIVV